MTIKKTPYLTNKDLLREIHKSKNTYCTYLDEATDHQYDIILPNLSDINNDTIAEAKKLQADRLAKQSWEAAQRSGAKSKLDDHAVDWEQIENSNLVFRIITWDHIPLAPGRKKNPKTNGDHHTKVNFPPFQHYRFNEENQLVCVGKSHWEGGLSNGKFSKDHGAMTPNLARMFMKLCERFGSKGNWRGYTYNDEMRSQALLQLSQVGLQFDESKSNNPFAYYTATMANSFTRVLNVEKRSQHLRDDILEMNGLNPSYTRQTENAIKSRETLQVDISPTSELGKS